MDVIYLLFTLIALVHTLPVPVTKVKSEAILTETEMTQKIKHVLNALGYSQEEIENALEIVPDYYGEKNGISYPVCKKDFCTYSGFQKRLKEQSLRFYSENENKQKQKRDVILALTDGETMLKPTPSKPTTTTPKPTTRKPTTIAQLNSINHILHELDLFWKG